jgi:hypothetical protein
MWYRIRVVTPHQIKQSLMPLTQDNTWCGLRDSAATHTSPFQLDPSFILNPQNLYWVDSKTVSRSLEKHLISLLWGKHSKISLDLGRSLDIKGEIQGCTPNTEAEGIGDRRYPVKCTMKAVDLNNNPDSEALSYT